MNAYRTDIRLATALAVSFVLLFLVSQAVAGMAEYCAVPPAVNSGVGIKPNVLIILDNSNSMDEDFYGKAVGSYSPESKAVVAKEDLRTILKQLKGKIRAGLMTYELEHSKPSYKVNRNVIPAILYNSYYFASYDRESYCPSPPPECVEYCKTGDLNDRAICQSKCQSENSDFNVDYFDEIITHYALNSSLRNKYCELVYPKTERIKNPTDSSHYVYYKHGYPDYLYPVFSCFWGICTYTQFSYSKNYNPAEGKPWDEYSVYKTKTGTSDKFVGYSDYLYSSTLIPSDTDIALGYKDFGRRLVSIRVSKKLGYSFTWLSSASPGDGYLHVPVGDLEDSFGNTTATYNKLWDILNPLKNDPGDYMKCTLDNKNECPYIIDAGLTPTAGTFETAIKYLEGKLAPYSSPIEYRCQPTFIVYVTDGLPSVDESGKKDSASDLMSDVLNKIKALRSLQVNIGGKKYTIDVRTYVLGVALSPEGKKYLDEMAVAGGTAVEKHAYYADNPSELLKALKRIFSNVLKRASSGTSLSVMAEASRSGASMIQALFWPKRYFDSGTSASWVGTLYDLWFYLGATPDVQQIRENSDTLNETALDKLFTLKDKVVEFFFDSASNSVKIKVCDDNSGSGTLTNCKIKNFADLKTVWNAGLELWKTNPSDRRIFTDVPGLIISPIQGNFVSSNASLLKPYLETSSVSDAVNIIDWVRGNHVSGLRDREVTIGTQTHVWKLGDIVDSSPVALSVMPVNSYYKDYGDKTYYQYNYNPDGSFTHPNRGVVFVGANDGMLHAFRMGALSFPDKPGVLAKLSANGGALGSEVWAFIPKDALPYLKYLADPNYCHIYTVDLTPYLVDVSIGGPGDGPSSDKSSLSWKTVLIGGMRLGGAPYGETPCSCGLGASSYFALDVTDPEHPKVMWEFSDKHLAFTTTGPAVVHISYKGNKNKDGYWYVVFASGPDGYDGTIHQPLFLYVLDLKTGKLVHEWQLSGNKCLLPSGTKYTCDMSVVGPVDAFAGRMFDAAIDTNEDYSDDAVYFGYSYPAGSHWKGGILRLATGEKPCTDLVCSWSVSKVIGDVGPVTAKVASMINKNTHNLWLYFGEGRYFTDLDDLKAQRDLYGIKDPCFSSGTVSTSCSTSVSVDSLTDVTSNPSVNPSSIATGWYIDLAPSSEDYGAERLITDPEALTLGYVLFTTFEPTSDVCGYGGRTYVWMVNPRNGGTPESVSGTLFLQTSTGAVNKINLAENFGASKGSNGGRKLSSPIAGVPPAGTGMNVVLSPPPVNKVLQWIEK